MNSSGMNTATQRHGQPDDGEADLLGPLVGRGEGLLALLDVAHDVLDHHDGVVDDEARRHGKRHQREVVETEAEELHHAERGHQRDRECHRRDRRRPPAAQERVDDQHHQHSRQHQRETCTSATLARIVTVRSATTTMRMPGGIARSRSGIARLMRSAVSTTLAPGWRWISISTAGLPSTVAMTCCSRALRRPPPRRADAGVRRCGRR